MGLAGGVVIRLGLALYTTVLGWMTALVPGVDHSALAWAVASQAHGRAEAALVTAVAFRESTFNNAAVGDHGRSVCAMQILGGPPELMEDPQACVAAGLVLLRESVRFDREHPLALYARGARWRSDEARRISGDRVRIAKELLAQ
jgi:hypothetical protein